MIELDHKKFRTMVLGSSVYSTGGGLELGAQLRMFRPNPKRKVRILSASELGGEEMAFAASGVGSAASSSFDPYKPLKIGMKILEQKTGKRFSAIFAGETNIDALVFSAASALGVAVLDADCTGGRAVPEIQFDNFVVAGIEIFPSVAVADDGKYIVLEEGTKIGDVDRKVRKLAANSKSGSVAIVDHPISISKARGVLTLGIFERSYLTGKYIESIRGTRNASSKMLRHLGGKLMIEGRVTSVSLENDKKAGFLKGHYLVKDRRGNIAKILVKNENVVCYLNGKIAAKTPDLILTVDSSGLFGVHNSKIKTGQRVFVVEKAAEHRWSSARGREIFDYRQFLTI